MGTAEMTVIGNHIANVVDAPDDDALLQRTAAELRELCQPSRLLGSDLLG
jgi:hypothetical protein